MLSDRASSEAVKYKISGRVMMIAKYSSWMRVQVWEALQVYSTFDLYLIPCDVFPITFTILKW